MRVDAEAGPRVGEAEVDPAHEREDAEDHDRAATPGSAAGATRGREPAARAAARAAARGSGRASLTVLMRGAPDGGAHDEARLDADDSGARGPAARCARAGARPRGGRARRAEVDGGQRRPGDLRERRCCPSRRARRRPGTSRPAVAQRGERADREQVVGAEDRVRLRARASRRSAARRPGSTMKSSATSSSASSRASPHERRPSR